MKRYFQKLAIPMIFWGSLSASDPESANRSTRQSNGQNEPTKHLSEPSRSAAPDSAWECNLDNELQKREIFESLELAQIKTFIGVHQVHERYAKNSDSKNTLFKRDEDIPKTLELKFDDRAERILSLMESHYSYTQSSARKSSPDSSNEDLAGGIAKGSAALPGLIPIGFGAFSQNGTKTLINNPRFAFRISGRSLVLSGVGFIASIFSGQRLSQSVLKERATDLSIKDQLAIQSNLFEPLENSARYLSDVLDWKEPQWLKFRSALRAEIFQHVTKSFENKAPVGVFHPQVFIEKFGEIDLISLIESQQLASGAQIKALRNLQKLYDISKATKTINERDSDKQIEILAQGRDSDAAIANIRELIRTRKMLGKVVEEIESGSDDSILEELVRRGALEGKDIKEINHEYEQLIWSRRNRVDADQQLVRNMISDLDSTLALVRELCKFGVLRGKNEKPK